jgi:prepilin-type N-terminal cleavage/methylation domain-containing protein
MRFFRDDKGLSLTELMVVSVLMSIIIATVYMLFGAAANITGNATARAVAGDEATRAIDKMTMDIRQAQESGESKGAFTIAEANRVQFFVDLTHDGKPEQVTYYVTGTKLYRTVASPTNAIPPFTYSAAGTPQVMVTGIDSTGGSLFCYHDITVNNTATCANAQKHGFNIVTTTDPYSTEPKIAMVGVNLWNKQSSGGKTITVHANAVARVRSILNTVK